MSSTKDTSFRVRVQTYTQYSDDWTGHIVLARRGGVVTASVDGRPVGPSHLVGCLNTISVGSALRLALDGYPSPKKAELITAWLASV